MVSNPLRPMPYCLTSLLLVFFIGIAGCNKGKFNTESCNGKNTRRSIKLVIDSSAEEVDTTVISATIDSLGSLDLVKADSETERQGIEKHIFTVTGKVKKVSRHRDGDIKVKLVSESEKFLNCEAPNVGCHYAGLSRFHEKFEEVRAFLEQNEDSLEGKQLTVTGVAFIDIAHPYPRNAAENNIELHPILKVSF